MRIYTTFFFSLFSFFFSLLSVGALSQQGLQGSERLVEFAHDLRRADGGYGGSVLRRRMVVVLVREGQMQFVTKLQEYFLGVFALYFKLRFFLLLRCQYLYFCTSKAK